MTTSDTKTLTHAEQMRQKTESAQAINKQIAQESLQRERLAEEAEARRAEEDVPKLFAGQWSEAFEKAASEGQSEAIIGHWSTERRTGKLSPYNFRIIQFGADFLRAQGYTVAEKERCDGHQSSYWFIVTW